MSYQFYMPSRVLFGAGMLKKLHEQELPGKKALIVISSGKSMRAQGYLDTLCAELEKAGVGYVIFDKILPNPIKTHVDEGSALAKAEGCDFVIGMGGGSSIDSAKAIAVMATNPGDYWDYISGGSGKGRKVEIKPLPIVAITTTAGTGTEADPFTVITKEDTQEKIGFGCDGTFPFLSIVDPELMASVPPHLTAYQGFDALFHSTEGYLNKGASPISDVLTLKAIELVGSSLAKAVKDGGDMKAREDVALANTLAGMVETLSGCISEHSIAHAMGAFYSNLPHGAALISISCAYYENFIRKDACAQRLIDMAKALGKRDAARPEDFVKALRGLQKACGVDNIELSSYGMKREELADIAKNARDTMGGLFAVDPAEVSDGDVLWILEKSYK